MPISHANYRDTVCICQHLDKMPAVCNETRCDQLLLFGCIASRLIVYSRSCSKGNQELRKRSHDARSSVSETRIGVANFSLRSLEELTRRFDRTSGGFTKKQIPDQGSLAYISLPLKADDSIPEQELYHGCAPRSRKSFARHVLRSEILQGNGCYWFLITVVTIQPLQAALPALTQVRGHAVNIKISYGHYINVTIW